MTPQNIDASPEAEDLRVIKENPQISHLVGTIRKNIGLSLILGEQHTTQGFPSAEQLALAFQRNLPEVDGNWVHTQVEEAKAAHLDVIQEFGLTDEDLRGLFSKGDYVQQVLVNKAGKCINKALT